MVILNCGKFGSTSEKSDVLLENYGGLRKKKPSDTGNEIQDAKPYLNTQQSFVSALRVDRS